MNRLTNKLNMIRRYQELGVIQSIPDNMKSEDEGDCDSDSVKPGGLETIKGAGPPISDRTSVGGTSDTDVVI